MRRLLMPLALLCGCAGAPDPIPAEHGHAHTVTVTVTDSGLLPGALVTIPAFATVVWRNHTQAPLVVEVHAAACNDCDTVLGFEHRPDGARATSIGPGGIATLCFHDAGTFAFVARAGEVEHRGTIDVGGGRGGR